MAQRPNPVRGFVAGFDWYGRSGRLTFALALAFAALPAALVLWSRQTAQLPRGVEIALILIASVLFVPALGHGLRRLNDLGRSGWWIWVMALPYAGVLLALFLIFGRSMPARRAGQGELRRVGFALAVVTALIAASTVFWQPMLVISGSMKPTLLIGDVLMVGQSGRVTRGDVIVYRKENGAPSVARLIGMGGDSVQMKDGVVWLNGVALPQTADGFFRETMAPEGPLRLLPFCANGSVGQGATCENLARRETMPDGRAHMILDSNVATFDNTEPVTVPQGQLFVLGDHRDNAADSRIAASAGGAGLIADAAVVGRAGRIFYSYSGTSAWQVWTWRMGRMLRAVH